MTDLQTHVYNFIGLQLNKACQKVIDEQFYVFSFARRIIFVSNKETLAHDQKSLSHRVLFRLLESLYTLYESTDLLGILSERLCDRVAS